MQPLVSLGLQCAQRKYLLFKGIHQVSRLDIETELLGMGFGYRKVHMTAMILNKFIKIVMPRMVVSTILDQYPTNEMG